MSANATIPARGVTLKYVVVNTGNLAVILASYWVAYLVISTVLTVGDVQDVVANPLYADFHDGFGFVFAIWQFWQYVAFFAVAREGFSLERFYFFPKKLKIGNMVWWFTVSNLLCAGFLWLGILHQQAQNTELGVPSTHIRLMEDSSVLRAGNAITHDPTKVGSVLVPLKQHVSHVFYIGDGVYQKLIDVDVVLTLKDRGPWRAISHEWDQLGWGLSKGPRRIAQSNYFDERVYPALLPAVTQVLEEVAQGELSADDSALKLRVGSIFHRMREDGLVGVSPVISEITITRVHVQAVRAVLE